MKTEPNRSVCHPYALCFACGQFLHLATTNYNRSAILPSVIWPHTNVHAQYKINGQTMLDVVVNDLNGFAYSMLDSHGPNTELKLTQLADNYRLINVQKLTVCLFVCDAYAHFYNTECSNTLTAVRRSESQHNIQFRFGLVFILLLCGVCKCPNVCNFFFLLVWAFSNRISNTRARRNESKCVCEWQNKVNFGFQRGILHVYIVVGMDTIHYTPFAVVCWC